jgi:thioredoxin 1
MCTYRVSSTFKGVVSLMETLELLRLLRDKLLSRYERLLEEYRDPLIELRGGGVDLESLSGVSFLYFTASWCAPCTSFMNVVRVLARRYAGKANFYRVNVDENMDLVDSLHVDYIPAFIAVVRGEVVDRVYGVVGRGRLEDFIRRVLESYG